jgi:hypothetical protein
LVEKLLSISKQGIFLCEVEKPTLRLFEMSLKYNNRLGKDDYEVHKQGILLREEEKLKLYQFQKSSFS